MPLKTHSVANGTQRFKIIYKISWAKVKECGKWDLKLKLA